MSSDVAGLIGWSFVRVLHIGGTIWEGSTEYPPLGVAQQAADVNPVKPFLALAG